MLLAYPLGARDVSNRADHSRKSAAFLFFRRGQSGLRSPELRSGNPASKATPTSSLLCPLLRKSFTTRRTGNMDRLSIILIIGFFLIIAVMTGYGFTTLMLTGAR